MIGAGTTRKHLPSRSTLIQPAKRIPYVAARDRSIAQQFGTACLEDIFLERAPSVPQLFRFPSENDAQTGLQPACLGSAAPRHDQCDEPGDEEEPVAGDQRGEGNSRSRQKHP